MNVRPISDLFSYILPFATSAPEPTVLQYARQAAIDFCKKTRSWRDVQDIDVYGDESEILTVPYDATIHEIEEAHFRSTSTQKWARLLRVPYDDIEQSLLDEAPTDRAAPNVISQVNFNSVVIAPRAAGTLRISSFLKPSISCEQIPAYLVENFALELADGALSHILMIPEQPYTNPNLAALKAGLFLDACDRNASLNIRGQQRAPARTKPSFM